MIKKAVNDMCGKAIDMGISHVEQELQIRPKTFARSKSTISNQINRTLDEYAATRSFFITGLIKEDILGGAKTLISEYVKKNLELMPSEEFEAQLLDLLKDYLPTRDSIGRVVNPAARATTIARTNISDLYNTTRLQMYSSPPLDGWVQALLYSAIMDGRTTEICKNLNGRIFTKETINGYVPPNHFNCRSVILPITRLDRGWEDVYAAQGPLTTVPQEGFA